MYDMAKDIWNSLIITHQGNKQVKDNKIDLFVQKYEEFSISDDETIDCAFARFNTIITSVKALDGSFSSRNHVRKFLRALPTKWRPKVTAIEESKDLSTLPLDELIDNLKIYEVVIEKDSEISKSKNEKYKSLALKERKVLSEEEASFSDSEDEEYAMAIKEDKKEKEDRRCFKCGDPNHFISDCPKHSYNDQKAFIVGCWSDSEDDSKKEEICFMALDNNELLSDTPYYSSLSLDNESWQKEHYILSTRLSAEDVGKLESNVLKKNDFVQITRKSMSNSSVKNVKQAPIFKLSQGLEKGWNYSTLQGYQFQPPNYNPWGSYPPYPYMNQPNVKLEPDEWIKDSGCSRHMTGNKDIFSSYKAIDGGNVVFGSNAKSKIIGKGQIYDKKCKVLFSETGSEILKDDITIGRGVRKNGIYIMKMGNSPKENLCLTSIDDTSTNMRLIQSLSSKELVRNLPKLKFERQFS
ncbi:zf-CCHC domain-containing protein [Tanacetum coccineum]